MCSKIKKKKRKQVSVKSPIKCQPNVMPLISNKTNITHIPSSKRERNFVKNFCFVAN